MTQRKNPLGRGLNALLENYETDIATRYSDHPDKQTASGGYKLPVDAIETNPFQPRTEFDDASLQELAKSIKEVGLIQPVTVRKMGYDRYQLISGERRFIASKMAGLTEIPAYIRLADDKEMLELALIENIQREDLDPVEIAIGFQRLIEECKLTHEELSNRIGKDRSTVTNFLRLLKLPAVIQLALKQKKISMAHARTLIAVDDTEKQLDIFQKILSEGLSVRSTENIVKNIKTPESSLTGEGKKNRQTLILSDYFRQVKESLIQKFGHDATVRLYNKGNGQIVIPFKSDAEFKKIAASLSL